MNPHFSRKIAAITLVLFLMQIGFVAPTVVSGSEGGPGRSSWTTTDTTCTQTVKDEAGNVISQRTYDKFSRKLINEDSPVVNTAQTENGKTEAKPEEKTEAKKDDADKPVWKNNVEFQASFFSTSDNTNHMAQELFNEKNGVGFKSINLNRESKGRLFRFRSDSLGTWNRTFNSDFDFHHQGTFHVRAKFRQNDWDFGTVLDPTTLRSTLNIDGMYDRPELKWRPRLVVNLRGEDTTGDSLRIQGSTDQTFPRSRFGQSWDPSHTDFNMALFGGSGNADFSVGYGENSAQNSSTKAYIRDMNFNGMQDLLNIWNWQNNFSKNMFGKASYRFNDRYTFSLGITTTSTDNEFDTVRTRSEPTNLLADAAYTFGLQGQNHGWLDAYSRTEEYVLEGKPNDLWDLEARVERRTFRNRAEGTLRSYNSAGTLSSSDDSATENKIDEGLFEFRADYYGFKKTPVYFGYRYLDREEFDNDALGTYLYNAIGTKTLTNTTRGLANWAILEETERMAYLGVKHRFSDRWAIDVRHEGGSMDDNHVSTTAAERASLVKDYDRVRQSLAIHADPSKEVKLMMKLRREFTDRKSIGLDDERQSFGLFANWFPTGRKFTVGAGYNSSIADISLPYGRYQDDIRTVSMNGTYKFCPKWSGDLDLSQTVSGDVTHLDYQIGQLRLHRQLNHGKAFSFGYARRAYDNLEIPAEKFINHVFFLSYNLPL